MVEGLTLNQFCSKYFDAAMKIADMTVADHIKRYGRISERADIDEAKSVAVNYALEKVYTHFDVDHESQAKLETYMSTAVRNQTITEIKAETSKVKLPDNNKKHKGEKESTVIIEFIPQGGIKQTIGEPYSRIGYTGVYEKKEEVILHMLNCMKQLPPIDQVILKNWMYKQKTYISDSIDELGWEHSKENENVVGVRCNRAKKSLGKLMGEKPNYRDVSLDPIPFIQTLESEDSAVESRKKATYSAIAKGVDYLDLQSRLGISKDDE